jgi:hypothetical protein
MNALSRRLQNALPGVCGGCFFVSVFGFIDTRIYTHFLRVQSGNYKIFAALSPPLGREINHALAGLPAVISVDIGKSGDIA